MAQDEATTVKSAADIAILKAQWEADPHWDIADTPGFEAHSIDLLRHQLTYERYRYDRRRATVVGCSIRYACSLETADYILDLEDRLARIEVLIAERKG